MGGATFQFGSGGGRPMGIGARVFLLLFSVVFMGIGLLFAYAVVRSTLETVATYRWAKTPCRIVASAEERTRDEESPYTFWVEYTYERKDAPRTSHGFLLSDWSTADYEDVQRLLDRYAPGTQTVCFVDPEDPERAILEHESLWNFLVILFPLLFVAVGSVTMVVALRGLGKGTDASRGASQTISGGSRRQLGPLGLALFFSPFLAVGLATLYPLGLRPILEGADARSWQKTPCTVIESSLRCHKGDDGDTYSVDVLYEYEWSGRIRRSNRYCVSYVSSSEYEAKAAIVERLPPGARTACWVNPKDPVVAVLKRDPGEGFLMMLFPAMFGLTGGLGVFFSLRSWWRARSPAKARAPEVRPRAPERRGPRILRPVSSPVVKFGIVLLCALVWNGITWIAAWQALRSWIAGEPELFFTIFISLLVLAGLLVAGLAFSQFLALFNPRVRLEVGADPVRTGEPVGLSWSLSRGARKITRLKIALEGREETVISSGKNSHTSKETFHYEPLVDTSPQEGVAFGSARLAVPEGAMHTFTGSRHKVVWALKVQGEIPAWPDLDDEFALNVEPG